MSEPEKKPQAAGEQTAATPETTLAAQLASLSQTVGIIDRQLYLFMSIVSAHSKTIEALSQHQTTTATELKRLDVFDKRLRHTEELCIPRPGETDLSIADAYQAMVHEIAALKVAVIDLQKRQKQLEGDTSPDRTVTIDPIYKSPSKH